MGRSTSWNFSILLIMTFSCTRSTRLHHLTKEKMTFSRDTLRTTSTLQSRSRPGDFRGYHTGAQVDQEGRARVSTRMLVRVPPALWTCDRFMEHQSIKMDSFWYMALLQNFLPFLYSLSFTHIVCSTRFGAHKHFKDLLAHSTVPSPVIHSLFFYTWLRPFTTCHDFNDPSRLSGLPL